MTRVFDERALSIQLLPNGFIIAYKKSSAGDDGKIAVGYDLVSFDNAQITHATRGVYQLAKFGTRYKQIEPKLPASFYWKSVVLPGERLLTYYPDGKAVIFDSEGEAIWTGHFESEEKGASDIIYTGKHLWCVYPFSKTIERKNPTNFKTDIKVGGHTSGFGSPTAIFSDGNALFVSDKQKCVVWKVDTENFGVREYLRFEEPVYQYFVIDEIAFVRLKSGVYKL